VIEILNFFPTGTTPIFSLWGEKKLKIDGSTELIQQFQQFFST
jgi:hypothetical protein